MIYLIKDALAFISISAFCTTMFVWVDLLQSMG